MGDSIAVAMTDYGLVSQGQWWWQQVMEVKKKVVPITTAFPYAQSRRDRSSTAAQVGEVETTWVHVRQ